MAEQLQPDWALTGDLARYDFLAWMLECRPTLEWRQGPVWVKYGDEPGIVHADDGWQASSRWMIPGMTALVLPEGTKPDMLSTLPLKPDTQLPSLRPKGSAGFTAVPEKTPSVFRRPQKGKAGRYWPC